VLTKGTVHSRWFRTVSVLAVLVLLALAWIDPDGVVTAAWGVVMGLVVAIWSLGTSRGSFARRMVVAGRALPMGALVGMYVSGLGTVGQFWLHRAYYEDQAVAKVGAARLTGSRPLVSIPDRRDSFYVFIFDPEHLGPRQWQGLTEMAGQCQTITREWAHCPIS